MTSLGGLGSWSLLFPKPAVAVISARYLRALHLRAEAFTDSEADAQAITEKTAAFLSIFHAAEGSVGAQGTDADVKTFFDSLKVEQSGDRAVLTATVPPGFIRKVLTEAPPETAAPAPPAAPRDEPPARKTATQSPVRDDANQMTAANVRRRKCCNNFTCPQHLLMYGLSSRATGVPSQPHLLAGVEERGICSSP